MRNRKTDNSNCLRVGVMGVLREKQKNSCDKQMRPDNRTESQEFFFFLITLSKKIYKLLNQSQISFFYCLFDKVNKVLNLRGGIFSVNDASFNGKIPIHGNLREVKLF